MSPFWSFVISLFWFAAFVVVGLTLAYRRVDLRTATITMGILLLVYCVFGNPGFLWGAILWIGFGAVAVLNIEEFRRDRITRSDFSPEGSPKVKRSPSMCLITPGSGTSHDG